MEKSKILIYGPNWLGDSIMAMPAIQLFAKNNPNVKIGIITKPNLLPLWEMQPLVHDIFPVPNTTRKLFETVKLIKQYAPAKIFIIPNSFRSAFIPLLAKVPQRIGFQGHFRSFLLTTAISPKKYSNIHQSREYYVLFDIQTNLQKNELPVLKIPERELAFARSIINGKKMNFAIIPGAARGPAKRWPAEYFAQLADKLYKALQCNIIILGSPEEYSLCYEIEKKIKGEIINLAGKTFITQFAAVLSQCGITICNDSGGMHLAAAVGSKVIAIYGITDPTKTGPMGEGHMVITAKGFVQNRAIPRYSSVAENALRSITPDEVFNTIQKLLLQINLS